MSKVCQVTGKRPVSGNNVSHAHNKTKRRFLPNLHYHRFWVENENRWVRLRVSSKGMRIIDKKGIDAVLADLRSLGVSLFGLADRELAMHWAAPAAVLIVVSLACLAVLRRRVRAVEIVT